MYLELFIYLCIHHFDCSNSTTDLYTLFQMSTTDSSQLNSEEEDPFYSIIKRTGCDQFHYKLQDCYDTNRDWKKCTLEMKEFKQCMDKNKK